MNAVQEALGAATRFLFFTGKGGVGKTSHACATAVALADAGRRVLLVSTDPASNLSEVLDAQVGPEPVDAPGVPGLRAMNIDPEASAAALRERAVGPMRGILPDDAVRQVEEQLSGACTVEVAAFDEFAALLADEARVGGYDHVVFDTAPTGHTLRLLQLPAAWAGFLEANPRGAGCLGPLGRQEGQRERYEAVVGALTDAVRTTVVLVSRPEAGALAEAERTSAELRELGLANQRLLLNGVFRATDPDDALAAAIERRGREALEALPANLAALPRAEAPLRPHNLVGVAALRALARDAGEAGAAPPVTTAFTARDLPPLAGLADEIEWAGHGLVMVMGKGGVGKTTVAAALAVELAGRGVPVHLSTTDPAAHVAGTLGAEVPGLRVSRIDPAVETEAYIDRVLATAGKDLDADGRALLEEDLRSPCTEEVAVFHAFSRIVNEGRRGVVILDTAPTGHTLLLLDATGAYHREVLRTSRLDAGRVATPMMRLQDPEHTRVLVVTLPETTPVLEAERLQADLRRAGIEPYAWVVNQSLAASQVSDPLLASRAAAEIPLIERVRDELAARAAVVPVLAEAPVGPHRLRELAAGGGQLANT
ncbi:arsenical pump-driving ATPase [Longimicrobium sp.]|uniref:arsenical pump-driving ATPase n=1 Tax=Longimicrobium sp. TaxID=2029185 RepID=UPI002E302070|nr:arsenical pump-driving ATPase [Longimicrobium sp.]HEX6037749.1 arsenical pump-driving ATPase [Longimicrobium sp.]